MWIGERTPWRSLQVVLHTPVELFKVLRSSMIGDVGKDEPLKDGDDLPAIEVP